MERKQRHKSYGRIDPAKREKIIEENFFTLCEAGYSSILSYFNKTVLSSGYRSELNPLDTRYPKDYNQIFPL